MEFKVSGYTFAGPFDSVDQLKNESGVYVVVTGEAENWRLLDCGEANDVKLEILNHLRVECWRKNAVEGRIAFVAKYCGVQQRQWISGEVRKENKPPCG